MKTLHTIIFSLPVLLLSACCWNRSDDTYVDFDDDAELLIYEVGDTLIYTSDLGNVDTFYVAEIEDFWSEGSSNEDFCDTYSFYKNRRYYFYTFPIINSDKFDNYITCTIGLPSLSWNNIRFHFSLNTSDFMETYELGSTIYQNVFYKKHYSHADSECYISKSYGILKYTLDGIETWTLTKTILKKQRK